jgi:uncharacterized protein (DUF433 family)
MTDSVIQAIEYIVKTPGFRDGEPHFAGRHLAVETVVNAYVNGGLSIEDIVRGYDLTPAQIYAALSYYYDHQDEIRAIWQEHERITDRLVPSAAERATNERLAAKRKQQGRDSAPD